MIERQLLSTALMCSIVFRTKVISSIKELKIKNSIQELRMKNEVLLYYLSLELC